MKWLRIYKKNQSPPKILSLFTAQIFLEIDLSVREVPVLPFNKKRPWKWQKNKKLNIKNEKEWITYEFCKSGPSKTK